MPFERISTPPVLYGKVAIVALGIIVLGVGLHSHYQSVCREDEVLKSSKGKDVGPCPSIKMEKYYVAIIIAAFVLSIVVLAITLLLDLNSRRLRLMDIGYHVIAGIMLSIGATVYIVSANQIKAYNKLDNEDEKVSLRYTEKIAAGGLTIIQVILHGTTALLLHFKR